MLSIVVPAYNEAALLGTAIRQMVDGLRALDLDFEVHIVENGSTDGTPTIATRIVEAVPEDPAPDPAPGKPDVLSPDYPLDFGSHARFDSPDEAVLEPPSRHGLVDEPTPSNGRHSRSEVDDAPSYGRRGRHSRGAD